MNVKALVVLSALGAAGYYGWQYYQKNMKATSATSGESEADKIFSSVFGNPMNDVLNNASGATRGFRNNNPTNMMWLSPINWDGQIGKDAQGFIIFSSAELGIRAAAKNLNSYLKSGRNTIRAISNSWTSTGRDTHMNAIRQRTGFGIDNIMTIANIPALIDGIIFAENSSVPYTKADIARAVSLAKLS